jgi:hypothetical protein
LQDKVDLLVTDDADNVGDLVADASGDIDIANPLTTLQQDIIFRGLTGYGEYAPDPFFGANLYAFKRKPNTRKQGDLMKAQMSEALLRDGRFRRGSVVVDCVPVSKSQVALPIFIKDNIAGTEDEILERTAIPIVTIQVDTVTGQISAITGGTR